MHGGCGGLAEVGFGGREEEGNIELLVQVRMSIHQHRWAERSAVEAAGAHYADLNDLICPYSPCPVVFHDVLAWRNRDHLTATFVKTLAPSLGRVVNEANSDLTDRLEAEQAALAAGIGTTPLSSMATTCRAVRSTWAIRPWMGLA